MTSPGDKPPQPASQDDSNRDVAPKGGVQWFEGEQPESWHGSTIGPADAEGTQPPQPADQAQTELPTRAPDAPDTEASGEPAPDSTEDGALGDDDPKQGRRRSKTMSRKQMMRQRRRMIAQGTVPEIMDYERPSTRAECRDAKRPCLYVSCRYHLYLDVNPITGSIKLNFPDKEVWQLQETCSLDVAERGGITLEEVGEIMNLTRERIRQVEVNGLDKLRQGNISLHTFVDGRELEIGPQDADELDDDSDE